MANTTSQSYTFDKTLPIDEIVEESYERIGLQNVSGYQLKTAKRSLNLLFSEWSNRGLHYWEVANQGFTLVDGTNVYTTYRSPQDGASNGLTTTLSAGINAAVTDIPLTEVKDMPGADQGGGTITIGSEAIRYTGKSAATGAANLTGAIQAKPDDVTGIIPVFKATSPKWSYAKLGPNGYVSEVAEKVPISTHATVGLYYFTQGRDFVWAADQMIAKDIRRNNEFYVCPVYNELIQRGDKIQIVESEFMWGLGTPEDVEHFERYYRVSP